MIQRHPAIWIGVLVSLLGCKRSEDAQVDRCGRALLGIDARAEKLAPGYDYLGDYVDGCSWIYREASCREAWQRAAKQAHDGGAASPSEDTRLAPVAEACAKAYCGKLNPRPRFCAGAKRFDEPETRHMEWPLLHRRILDRELAHDPALLAALHPRFGPMFVASLPDLPKPAGSDASPSMVFGIVVHSSGELDVDGARTSDERLLTLAKEAIAKNPEARAVIRADKAVAHGRIVAVIDLLKQAGFSRIAFGVSAADAGD